MTVVWADLERKRKIVAKHIAALTRPQESTLGVAESRRWGCRRCPWSYEAKIVLPNWEATASAFAILYAHAVTHEGH